MTSEDKSKLELKINKASHNLIQAQQRMTHKQRLANGLCSFQEEKQQVQKNGEDLAKWAKKHPTSAQQIFEESYEKSLGIKLPFLHHHSDI